MATNIHKFKSRRLASTMGWPATGAPGRPLTTCSGLAVLLKVLQEVRYYPREISAPSFSRGIVIYPHRKRDRP